MARAILFDLFNTLVPGGDRGSRAVTNRRMGTELGIDPDRYARAFFEAWPERFVGALGDLADTVRAVAERVGGSPTDAQVHRAADLRRKMTAGLLAAAPAPTVALLDKLRADGVPLGLVSNATAETPDRFRESALLGRLDVAVFSCEVAVAKPEPEIYRHAARALGVDPAECVFVGDGADQELTGAAALGMTVIRTVEHADSDPDWSGPTLARLSDLPTLLPSVTGRRA